MSETATITSAQMRHLERSAMESGQVTGLELMERAGQGVVDAIIEEWPQLENSRAVILCGPGNNGGDGFVVARLLKERGWSVSVYFWGDAERLPLDARTNYDRWNEIGKTKLLEDSVFDGWPDPENDVDVVIDAIFGIGLTRPFVALGHMQDQLNYIQAHYHGRLTLPGGVVAIDVPSGLDADSGLYPGYEQENPLDGCVVANLTVTFHALKHCHIDATGVAACGNVVVKDIGL